MTKQRRKGKKDAVGRDDMIALFEEVAEILAGEYRRQAVIDNSKIDRSSDVLLRAAVNEALSILNNYEMQVPHQHKSFLKD